MPDEIVFKFIPPDVTKISNLPIACQECKYLKVEMCGVECMFGNALLEQPCKDHEKGNNIKGDSVMSESHDCKWCGSDDCDALVVCDLCFEDISEADPIYHYDPEDPEADGDGYIRICKQCEFTLTLAKISV